MLDRLLFTTYRMLEHYAITFGRILRAIRKMECEKVINKDEKAENMISQLFEMR